MLVTTSLHPLHTRLTYEIDIYLVLEVLEKNLFPCFLQVLDTARIPLLINLSIFKVSNGHPCLSDDAISLLF